MATRKKKKEAGKPELELLQVRPNRHVLWPGGEHRAGPGDILRSDDPFLEQRHNLSPAPPGTKIPCGPAPDGYSSKWTRRYKERILGQQEPDKKEEKLEAFVAPAADEVIAAPSDGIKEPDAVKVPRFEAKKTDTPKAD